MRFCLQWTNISFFLFIVCIFGLGFDITIVQGQNRVESDNSYVHIRAVIPIASGLNDFGQFKEAKDILQKAIHKIDDIPHIYTISLAIYKILDEFNDHTAQYQDLILAAQTIPKESSRLTVLAAILYHMGFKQTFPEMFDQGSSSLEYYWRPME